MCAFSFSFICAYNVMSDLIFKQNYFEIFSQSVSTQPDLGALKEKNYALQLQVHPDKFVNSNDADKRQAMQKTSLINEAYETLNNPVSRLQYMLTLKGIDMKGETDTSMDGLFLMEQMELREEIADIKFKSDPLDSLDSMTQRLKNQSAEFITDFAQAFENDALDEGREIVRKLQFLLKAQKEVNDKIEQIEDELI